VCSGFPKRSCSIKKLKRDDDSSSSLRALGHFGSGWIRTEAIV
jgi:hypothetical protein